MKIIGIDHPAIAVEDVDKIADWYCDVLQYTKIFRNDKPVWILKAPDHSLLEEMPIDGTEPTKRKVCTPALSHVALRLVNLEDAVRFLANKGVHWLGEVIDVVGGRKNPILSRSRWQYVANC